MKTESLFMFEKKKWEKQFISASFVERLFSDYKDTYPSKGLTRNIGVPALTNHEEVNAAMGPCTISHCPPKGGVDFYHHVSQCAACHNIKKAWALFFACTDAIDVRRDVTLQYAG